MSRVWKTAVTLLMIISALAPVSPSRIASGRDDSQAVMPCILPASGCDEPLDWPVYRNTEYGFQIRYPPNFGMAQAPNALGAQGAVVTFVPTYDPSVDGAGAKTNLIAFSVTVGVMDSFVVPSRGIASCLSCGSENGLDVSTSQWLPFIKRHLSEGAVGNRYETLSYVTDWGDRRYEIALFLHSGNPGCYLPGTITIFDRFKITRLFDTMVGTFLPTR